MPRDRDALARLELAAHVLHRCSRAYTRKNLFHAWRRTPTPTPAPDMSFVEFENGPLARRLARGPLAGLLRPSPRWDGPALGREWDAYFPRSILLVDARSVLDLFVASGIMTTARMAVVCIDGSPGHVVDWLSRGFRAGHRAPIGYLHDATTAFFPFAAEPVASLVASERRDAIDYVDLGLPVRGALARKLPLVRDGWAGSQKAGPPKNARVTELEALPPCTLLAWAARRMISRVPGDPQMAPLVRDPKEIKRP